MLLLLGVQRGGYLLSLFEGSIEGAIVRDVTEPVVGETFLQMMKTHSK